MERGNSTLKKILSDVCAERKKEGKTDNWVLCLGRIMAGLSPTVAKWLMLCHLTGLYLDVTIIASQALNFKMQGKLKLSRTSCHLSWMMGVVHTWVGKKHLNCFIFKCFSIQVNAS